MKKPTLTMLAGLMAIGSAVMTGSALAASPDAAQAEQYIQRMEQHWRQVIGEEDPERRRALMREHRQIMDEAEQAMGGSTQMEGGMGMHDGGHGMGAHPHADVMNTIEMHRHMMDMMQ